MADLHGKFADVPGQQAMDLDDDDPGALTGGGDRCPYCGTDPGRDPDCPDHGDAGDV